MCDREQLTQQVRDMFPDMDEDMVQKLMQRAQDVADWVPVSLEDAVAGLQQLLTGHHEPIREQG